MKILQRFVPLLLILTFLLPFSLSHSKNKHSKRAHNDEQARHEVDRGKRISGEDVTRHGRSYKQRKRAFKRSTGRDKSFEDLDPVLLENEGAYDVSLKRRPRKGIYAVELHLQPNVQEDIESGTTIDLDGAAFAFAYNETTKGYDVLTLRINMEGNFVWKVVESVGPTGYAYLDPAQFEKLSELRRQSGLPLLSSGLTEIFVTIDYEFGIWRLGKPEDENDHWFELPHHTETPRFNVSNGTGGKTLIHSLTVTRVRKK